MLVDAVGIDEGEFAQGGFPALGDWCSPATADRDARPAHLSSTGEGPRTPATNWAGNVNNALGPADAEVCFRKELG